ncbi:Uncharacterised protein [uncultured archaeon]|nr:Uncharacterised protein [uncultured archaeon]
MNSSQSITDLAKTIAPIITIALIIFGGASFIYNNWYKTPKLTYETLDSYPLSNEEYIIPIIIRNEGHEKATNVRITVYTAGNIDPSIPKKTPEELTINIESNSTLIANIPRLTDGTQILLYPKVKTLSQKPINEVLIASDQGSGSVYEQTNQWYVPIVAFMIGLLIAGLEGVIERPERIYKLKNNPPASLKKDT